MTLYYETFDFPFSAGGATWGYHINNAGQIAGYYLSTTAEFHGLVRNTDGTFVQVGPSGTKIFATGINDSDQVVGYSQDASSNLHGWEWTGSGYVTLNFPAATSTLAADISDSGLVVGSYNGNSGFIYNSTTSVFTSLSDPIATNGTFAWGINDSGLVVGYFLINSGGQLKPHGFIYNPNGATYTTLDDPAGTTTILYDINDSGQIVGQYTDGSGATHSFIYTNGAFKNIDDPGSGISTYAFGINNSGEISGYVTRAGLNYGLFASPTPPASNDFNGNGTSDILWRQSGTGALAEWFMNGAAIASSGTPTFRGSTVTPDSSWSAAGIGDFNGDGNADVLWRNTSGEVATWLMNGNAITSGLDVTSGGVAVRPDASWSVVGIGDFNGDGEADVLWRNTSGELTTWLMNGNTINGSGDVTSGGVAVRPDATWSVAGIGDFNGDGKRDILWRNSSGEVAEWQMNGAAISGSSDLTAGGLAARPDATWNVAGIGDFNGDGNSDVVWRNNNGSLAVWLMNGSTITSSGLVTSGGTAVAPDATWHVVEIGDFNGDHNSDILWRNDNGSMAEWLMNGTSISQSLTLVSNGSPVGPDATWTTQTKPTIG